MLLTPLNETAGGSAGRKPLKIGLFGGSFDPVHCGHLLVAQASREELGLDRVIFIPVAQSPFKPGAAPSAAVQRLRLLRLALAGHPDYDLDLQEIERGGTSYTVDTLRDYRARLPEARFFYLIGSDHVPSLPKWRDPEALAALAEFVVIPRPGQLEIPIPAPFTGHHLRGFPLGVSSSVIRSRIQAGLTIRGLVPEAVAEAISNSGLYLSPGISHH